MSKTISIDREAYEILKSHKVDDESFSDVIKKHMAKALVGKELVDILRKEFAALDKPSKTSKKARR